jgi:hypothetical protein
MWWGEAMSEGESCKSCKFFVRDRLHVKNGTCRAHAPVLVNLQTPQGFMTNGMFPPVAEDCWCGEYRMKVTLDERVSSSSVARPVM